MCFLLANQSIGAVRGDAFQGEHVGFQGQATAATGETRPHGRGGQGVISMQTNARNGQVVGAVQVEDTDEVMLITNAGTLIRTRVSEISVMGRNTQGVRVANVGEGEKLVGVERIEPMDETADDAAGDAPGD